MTLTRKSLFTAASALVLSGVVGLATPVVAADENNVGPGLTYVGAPLGLHGADPVALIKTGKSVEGTAQFAAAHEGVSYYFSSQANLDAFKANPSAFLPQFGGFCTFGASVGKKFDGDPRYASVRDGKLYVFLNKDIYEAYQKDPAGVIAKANENWKTIRSKAAKDL